MDFERVKHLEQEVERLRDERKGMVHEVAYRHAVARAEEAEALLEQMQERLDARERDPVGMQERRRAEAAEARNAELVKALEDAKAQIEALCSPLDVPDSVHAALAQPLDPAGLGGQSNE